MEAVGGVGEAPPPYSEAIADDSFPQNVVFRDSTLFNVDRHVPRASLALPWTSEALPPPTTGQRLTFCDFLPSCDNASTPARDTFSSLLCRANDWLRLHPGWRVKNCETIRVAVDTKNRQYLTEVYYDDEKKECITVLGIRLWLTRAEQDSGVSLVQPELGVVHMVPLSLPIVNRAGKTVLAFENLQQLFERYKRNWENEPLPGRFLCVDTQKTSVSNIQNFNPENVIFHREEHYVGNTLEMIRVFYEIGPSENESIEIVDFLPLTTIPILGSIQREPFQDVFYTAKMWLKKHCWDAGHRLLNIQTLELDVRPRGRSDTGRLWSTAEAKKEYYVRFLRAAFVSGSTKNMQDVNLNYDCIPGARTFAPVPVPGSTQSKLKFESLQKSRERLEAWIKATGAQVLSAETVWLRSPLHEHIKKTSQSSAMPCSGSCYRWLSAVRLYLDKDYADPPAAMLPAMPKEEGMCSIS